MKPNLSVIPSGAGLSYTPLTEQQIVQWAQMLRTRPVLRRITLEGELTPIKGLGRPWCEARGVLPLADGRVLAASQEHLAIVRSVVEHRVKTTVVPTLDAVLRELLEEIFSSAPAVVGIEMSDVEIASQRLLERAVQSAASDIHIEVRPERARIRMRQNGRLHEFDSVGAKTGMAMVRVLFNFADVSSKMYDPNKPQDASKTIDIHGKPTRIRIASIPTYPFGVDAAIRLLPSNQSRVDLRGLGYAPEHEKLIAGAVAKPHGITLIAGPTGSGKSTTLAAMINALPEDEKIITIENPPEYLLRGRTQVPADPKDQDRNFAAMIRATMRTDPDGIMVGEIRDAETAEAAFQAALTGHKVFGTIHTKSAITIVPRLVGLGISPSLLADPELIVCLMFQRLVPMLCPRCAVPLREQLTTFRERNAGLYERLLLALDRDERALANVRLRKNGGCNECKGRGEDGRAVAAEVVYMDQRGREFIEHGAYAEWYAHLLAQGWRPIRDHVIDKIRTGRVSPQDAERVVGSLAESGIGNSFDYRQHLNRLGGEGA